MATSVATVARPHAIYSRTWRRAPWYRGGRLRSGRLERALERETHIADVWARCLRSFCRHTRSTDHRGGTRRAARPARLYLQERASVSDMSSPSNARLPVSISNSTPPKAQSPLRFSTARPLACSGVMYAAVPRIIPACVIAGVVIVGTSTCSAMNSRWLHRFRQAEVEHLHRAVGADLDVRGFQVAMDDALLVRRFQRLGNLLRDRQRFVDRDRAARDALRRSSPSTSSITSAVRPRLFEAVDRGDVRMIQRREDFRFA